VERLNQLVEEPPALAANARATDHRPTRVTTLPEVSGKRERDTSARAFPNLELGASGQSVCMHALG